MIHKYLRSIVDAANMAAIEDPFAMEPSRPIASNPEE
jgi:hypothetical protein